MDYEVPAVHPAMRIVSDPPELRKKLKWYDVSDPALVQPHTFDIPEVPDLGHCGGPAVAMPDEPAVRLLHVPEEGSMGRARITRARVDVEMVRV